MDKYRKAGEKILKGQHPDMIAKEALNKAEFSSREREYFFDEAYGGTPRRGLHQLVEDCSS